MQTPDRTDAPLPEFVLAKETSHTPTLRNGWNVLVTAVPIYSERVRYNITAKTGLPLGGRSPLRTGTLTFTERGLDFDASEIVPSPVRERLSLGIYFILYLIAVGILGSGQFVPSLHRFGPFAFLLMLCAWISRWIFARVTERQLSPVQLAVPWEQVLGAQIDRNGSWLTLVYGTVITQTVSRSYFLGGVTVRSAVPGTGCHLLTLNRLDPATVEGIAETIRHFAPHSRCVTVDGFEWTMARKIVYGFIAFLLLLLVTGIGIVVWKAIFP